MEQTYTPDRSTLYGYKLDRILGRGGTGIVYRAFKQDTGEVVAIKLFRVNFFRNRLHMRNLAKCAKRFSKFSHENVVKTIEFIHGKEGSCLVMEYVDGPDLRWYIKNRSWNLQERLVIVSQICNGLQYIHDQGFVHHDFKPANVMFTRKGVVKLTDYSLCGNSFLLSLFDPTMHDQVTPMYVAPDLIRKEKASPQSDMYSLGATMYLMFTGGTPFQSDNLQKLYECHLHVVPDHPTDVNPRCPREVGDVIMRLMAKTPQKRFKDCDELRIVLADATRRRI